MRGTFHASDPATHTACRQSIQLAPVRRGDEFFVYAYVTVRQRYATSSTRTAVLRDTENAYDTVKDTHQHVLNMVLRRTTALRDIEYSYDSVTRHRVLVRQRYATPSTRATALLNTK